MQPHQERVIAERAELLEKTNKLSGFLFTVTFDSLDVAERSRLVRQYGCMRMYLEILAERIAAFQ